MKTKILADFQICISVPLSYAYQELLLYEDAKGFFSSQIDYDMG